MPQADGDGVAGAAGGPDLAGSGLLTQHHPLSFTLLSADQDEVMQSWTRLLESSYVLSVAYVGRVVLIEPDLTPEPSLPARRTAVHFRGMAQPRLETLVPASLTYDVGAELELRGANLSSKHVQVSIGELEVEPISRTADSLTVLLPSGVPAGSPLVRVVHGEPRDGEVRWNVASNPLALVVRPRVLDARWQRDPEPDDETATEGGSRVLLQVRFAPPVTVTTEVDLLLNASPTPEEPVSRRGYTLRGTAEPSRPDLLEMSAAVEPGRYLVRVRIAGVDSPLTVDEDPASPTFERFVGPLIEIAER